MKISIESFATVTLAVIGFALLPDAHGVVPAPDGGYPGFNTAEGDSALLNLGSGVANTAVGWFSLKSDIDGSFNTAVGAGTLLLNVGDQNTGEGTQNTATGAGALLSNTTGFENTADGAFALFNNTTGIHNNAVGSHALFAHTTGNSNNAVGAFALGSDTGGLGNNAFGESALVSNITGIVNTAIGDSTLLANTTGNDNTAIGVNALANNTTGSNNLAVGDNAGLNISTANNVICIGHVVDGADVSNTTWIGNVYGVTTQSGTTAPVIVSDTGQLGTVASSQRFKKDIATMERASEAILALRPVTFHYKSDTKDTPQFGLIAEEVAKVNPALVLPDKEGKPYTVRYDAVNAMLLNEFLKEHRKMEQQEATITNLRSAMAQQRKDFETAIVQQQKTTEALVARLNQQEARIQRASAQVEMSRSGSQMLVENQ
jgi:hypothetical protein